MLNKDFKKLEDFFKTWSLRADQNWSLRNNSIDIKEYIDSFE